jgi:hypothetical protein
MRVEEAERHLAGALARDPNGRFAFACKNALVTLRLRGSPEPLRFVLHDNVGFRTGRHGLTIEHLKTGAVRKRFAWDDLESVAAGEPEMADGSLFQG